MTQTAALGGQSAARHETPPVAGIAASLEGSGTTTIRAVRGARVGGEGTQR